MPHNNILFILHRLPYPLNSGGKQAIFNGLDAVKDDCNIVITYAEDPAKDTIENKELLFEALAGKIRIEPFCPQRQPQRSQILPKILNRISNFIKRRLHGKPAEYNPCKQWVDMLQPPSQAYIKHVNNLIAKYHIDIVQCEMLINLSFVRSLPKHVKTIFVHHELGFIRHELELQNPTYAQLHGEKYAIEAKRMEIELLNCYDHVITLSKIDLQKLIDAGVTTSISDSFAIVKPQPNNLQIVFDPYHLTFIGSDNHEPNLLGLQWFLEKCWPTLIQTDDKYHLTVIGKWSEYNSHNLSAQYHGVSFIGFVDNLASVLCGSVMIVPITVGSGIRMKILEAAGMNVPFVSTSVGAEGLPFKHGKHCLIADSPSDFVRSIQLFQDTEQRRLLVENARQLVNQHFSPEALRQNRLSIYQLLYAPK